MSGEKTLNTLCKHIVTSRSFSVLGIMKDETLVPYGVQHDGDFHWPVIKIPELAPLMDQFDFIMARKSRWSFQVICIKNRVFGRSGPLQMSLEQVRKIGRECSKYAKSINGEQSPVRFQVWEVIDSEDSSIGSDQKFRERVGLNNIVGVSYWSLNTSTLRVQTNEKFNGFFAGRRAVEKALAAAIAEELPTPRGAVLKLGIVRSFLAKIYVQKINIAKNALVWGWVLLALLTIAYHQFGWSLINERITFHDRIVLRLENFDRWYPKAHNILEIAKFKLEESGFEIVRFSSDSPVISDYHKDYMEKWAKILGMVSWSEKQVIFRLNNFELLLATLGLDFGSFDTTILHEMIHVADGGDGLERPSMSQAEDQLYLCLDESQRPVGWIIFEKNLVEELVAYLASNMIIYDESIYVPSPHEIKNPDTDWEKTYVEWLDYLIPECFTRAFGKSVVGWSGNFTDEEAKVLRQRVERLKYSEYLHREVRKGLRRFGLL